MMNPEWLPGILEEIDHLGRSPTYSDLIPPTTTLPRLIAFISEVLRLHPALPLEILESTAEEPIILPDGAIVQPQDKVIWSPWVMARSPNIWGPDADVFDPDRFMDSDPRSAAANKKTAFEWPVFHAGPRSCLGKNLARAEIAYALFEILGRYEIHMAWDGSPREVGGGLTSHMQGGLPVRVTRRDG
jgi:cytochrome P450